MGKNKISQSDINAIQNMSYTELGKAVVHGSYSLKQLRNAYTQMRDIAQKRIGRLNKPGNVKQFGKPDDTYFRKTKDIVTSSDLLREIRDVSKFLTNKGSTIKGLKERRDFTINKMKELGFDVKKADYPDIQNFMKWFKASEYSKKYDSDSPEVVEVFNTEKASPEDWRKAFNAIRVFTKIPPVQQY